MTVLAYSGGSAWCIACGCSGNERYSNGWPASVTSRRTCSACSSAMAPIRWPVPGSIIRKWCVNRTGTRVAAIIRAWSQLAVTVPVQNARPHSGSYSRRFCGDDLP